MALLSGVPHERALTDLDEQPHEPLKDRPFNPWRLPKSDRARAIVEDVIRQVQNYEKYYSLRRRRRKEADQQTFQATITAIICDVMHHHLTGSDRGLFITRSNEILGRKSRYRPPAYGQALPYILDCLASPDLVFITQHLSQKNPFSPNRRTTIQSGYRLISRIEDHEITLTDMSWSQDQEVIVLKHPKEGFWDDGEKAEYEDTPATGQYRREIQEINAWLGEADIEFDEAEADDGRFVDASNRRLRRIFTRGCFDSGGRLFGGFWQTLSKRERRNGIEIQGEPTLELDYGQMAPRILYGLVGVAPPSQDLYLVPGLEPFRIGVKKLMNAMLFATERLIRMPKNLRRELGHHTLTDIMAAIEEAHSALKPHFFTGVGHQLQFRESQILVALLLALRAEGIVGLPIHDAVLIPASRKIETTDIMLSTFHTHAGVEGMVEEKR